MQPVHTAENPTKEAPMPWREIATIALSIASAVLEEQSKKKK